MLLSSLARAGSSVLRSTLRPAETALLRPSAGALSPPPAAACVSRWLKTMPMPMQWRTKPPPPGQMPRAERITEEHIGQTFLVHSGKDLKRVKVTSLMVDHKFGEFVLTRKTFKPPQKKQQGKKR